MVARARGIGRPAYTYPASRYVDFDLGNDAADGQTPFTPWKHAPGDPNATGIAAGYSPSQGNIIQFLSETYRGKFTVAASGTIESPIRYLGKPGTRTKIMGSDIFSCPAASCAGDMTVPSYIRSDQFLSIDITGIPVALENWRPVKLNGQYLEWSQFPTPNDFWSWDDAVAGFDAIPGNWRADNTATRAVGAANGAQSDVTLLLSTSTKTAALAAADSYAAHDIGFRIYTKNNAIYSPSHCTYDAGTGTITGEKTLDGNSSLVYGTSEEITSYPFALTNHPNFLVQPKSRAGMCCTLAGQTRLIVRRDVSTPYAGTVQLEVSVRDTGINLNSKTDIEVSGFEICDQSATIATSGVAGIYGGTGSQPYTNLRQRVDDCIAHHISYQHGLNYAMFVRGLVQRVRVYDCWEARAIAAFDVLDFDIRNMNYSALSENGGWTDATVERGYIADIQSVHGNAMTFYLACQRMQARNITIFDAPRPFATSSPSTPTPNDYRWDRCVISGGNINRDSGYSWGDGDFSQGGLINWDKVDGMAVTSCVLLSTEGAMGARISVNSVNVSITASVVQGVFGGAPALTNNLFVADTGFTASGGNTKDTSKLDAARAMASYSPMFDAGLMTVLRNGDASPDFYVGAPIWADVQPPVKVTDPIVTKAGNTLTVTPGACSQNKYNSRDYQWFKNGVGIAGATGLLYDTAGVTGIYSVRERHHNYAGTLTLSASYTV